MAETLGSLIDKLSIKSIREFHLQKMLKKKKAKFPKADLKRKLIILRKQKNALRKEIEDFVVYAAARRTPLTDEKLKLYNKPRDIGAIGSIKTIAHAIDGLCKKNMELWNLEDEARRSDVGLSYIGSVKRKIDRTNQKRNDFIDRIDALLKKRIQSRKRR